jgi:hypothetical protein
MLPIRVPDNKMLENEQVEKITMSRMSAGDTTTVFFRRDDALAS